jgi:putative transposase
MKVIGNVDKPETGRWLDHRAEDSHQPFLRRERAMCFIRMRALQKLVAVHALVHTHFDAAHQLYNRSNFKLNRAVAFTE